MTKLFRIRNRALYDNKLLLNRYLFYANMIKIITYCGKWCNRTKKEKRIIIIFIHFLKANVLYSLSNIEMKKLRNLIIYVIRVNNQIDYIIVYL